MENKLKSLFEFQRFAGNSRLAKMIEDTDSRYGAELSDDDIAFLNAAGDLTQENAKPEAEKKN